MDDATKFQLLNWQTTLSSEIREAESRVEAAQAALASATAIQASEATRVQNLRDALSRARPREGFGNALSAKVTTAMQMCPEACTRGHAEALAEAQFALADLHTSMLQIMAALAPPPPPTPVPKVAQALSPDNFETIVMPPARLAVAS